MSAAADWTDAESVMQCCGSIALDDRDAAIAEAITVASELLYVLSQKQFSGVCTTSIRPCDSSICMGPTFSPIYQDDPTAQSYGNCGCRGNQLYAFKNGPVTNVGSVIVDGEIIDPSEYRITSDRYLLRLAGPGPNYVNHGWPLHQHLDRPLTALGTWGVTYTYGTAPPLIGKRAATALACEFVKACANDETCQLPGRVTSLNRQGLTMTLIDPNALSQGLTGVYETDLFLSAYNPKGLRGGALVWSPDLAPAPWT